VLLRADMDALPVREQTGLGYASTARGADGEGRDVPLMHARGHDMHVACLLGAAAALAAGTPSWHGTLQLVFQPAEETGEGARAMIDDGLFDRLGTPDVVLGQHVAPIPAGTARARKPRSTRSSWQRRPSCDCKASCPVNCRPPIRRS
jgi:metal-dependent amidase/aminoacylase/carboxypeptidase family protein